LEIIALLLLVLFIGIAILVNAFYRRGKQQKAEQSYVIEDLGLQPEVHEKLVPLIEHLNQSLDDTYVEQVCDRVIREHQISLTEWENRWFEWKRFLILVALFRDVPMYSREIDEIWHEMLMFTNDYDRFCQQYLKTLLHHTPKLPGSGFDQQEKARFDWYYATLFQLTPYSQQIWGSFFEYPLERKILDHYRDGKDSELFPRYFNQPVAEEVPKVQESASFLVDHLQAQIRQIDQFVEKNGVALEPFAKQVLLPQEKKEAQAYLFLSLFYADRYKSQRKVLHNKLNDLRKKRTKHQKTS
jgi:hypothetical protein